MCDGLYLSLYKNIILSFYYLDFDGSKWFGIRFFENYLAHGGVMIDDIVAGCYASFLYTGFAMVCGML